jgi:peptidoglycan/LPS O-acetylase OafA/YrhL
VLLGTLAGLFVVLVAWRFHSFGVENIFIVFNRTTVRMDPFVIGAIAAAVVPRMPRADTLYRHTATVLLVLIVPVLYWCERDASYLQWGGTFLEIIVAGFLLCIVLTPPAPAVDRVLGNRVLTTLGAMSLVIYLWHFPIFHFVRRHADWPWGWKALVAFLATAAIAWLAHVIVEKPVSRLLARPVWDEVREGNFRSLVTSRQRERHHSDA